jgi:hypothetical protein
MTHRLIILLQSLLAVIWPRAFTRSLAEDDLRLEVQTNRQLAEAPPESRREFLVKGEHGIIERATLLRRKLASAFALLVGAVVLGLLVRWVISPVIVSTWKTAVRDLSMVSLFLFAWATLGRMGWGGQSYVGNTVMERADDFILRALYALGIFFGVLAVTWQ